jgi:alkylhydroperoxidase family enzyme
LARLPYVGEGQADTNPDLRSLYADISDLRGGVLNLYKTLAHQPKALRAFMVMSRYVRDDSSLDSALRELAILATGYALDVAYEKYHHVPAARRAGVSEAKLAAFPNWQSSAEFTEVERAVLAYADSVARTRTVDDGTFRALQDHLSSAEIVDLALTVGWYHLCAAILGPIGIETEDKT